MLKRLIYFVLIGILPALVFAQNKSAVQRIVKNGELLVGTSGGQPPYSVKAKDGKLMGYEIDLAEILAEAMDVKLKLVVKPFSELVGALEKGEVDMVLSGMTITPERNLKVAFMGPYILSGRSILAKEKRLAALDELDEINRKSITVVALKGSVSQRYVEKLAPNVKLITVDNYEAGVKMVLNDKTDLMIADYSICVLSILRHPDEGLATLEVPLTIEPVGVALPPHDILLQNLVGNYLGALQMAGILDELEQKWFKDGSWLIRLP